MLRSSTARERRGSGLEPWHPLTWLQPPRRFAKRSAISRAVRTASAPLSKRGSAWSGRSSVSTPNETGTPVSIAASWSPEAASLAT